MPPTAQFTPSFLMKLAPLQQTKTNLNKTHLQMIDAEDEANIPIDAPLMNQTSPPMKNKPFSKQTTTQQTIPT